MEGHVKRGIIPVAIPLWEWWINQMSDVPKIIAGLVISLGLMAFPFWYNLGRPAAAPQPELDVPAIQQLSEKRCVEAVQYMKASHMQLLNDWRTWVVRQGDTIYVANDGEKYNMSFEGTCMKCHTNKAQFCDRCHSYIGVEPECWNCHVEPEEEIAQWAK